MTAGGVSEAYFERVGDAAFRATEHVGGAWTTHEQHIAPALGLIVHAIERDRDARRDDGLSSAGCPSTSSGRSRSPSSTSRWR
jgi:hypothetical protein